MVTARHAGGAAREPASEPAVADLHTHTTRSDGVLEPAELLAQVGATPVRLLSVTDHDSLAAFRELTGRGAAPIPAGLTLIPGVEINAVTRGLDVPGGELHILGFEVDPDDEAFEAALREQRLARRERYDRTLARLRELGLPIDAQLAHLDLDRDDALGRPTIARGLMAAGHAASVDDAFERLLGYGRPAYVPRAGLGPLEAIRAVRAAGGFPVLAHFPAAAERRSLIAELVDKGLAGLESHHRSFDEPTRASVAETARGLRLLVTGGTDYHGDLGPYAASHAELVYPASVAAAAAEALSSPRPRSP